MIMRGRMGGWGIGVACALVPAGVALAAPAPQYQAQNIGVLGQWSGNGFGYSEAHGVSHNGVVTGSATKYVDGVWMGTRAVVWLNGELQEIGPTGTDNDRAQSYPRGVTPGGLVAANMQKYNGTTAVGERGVVWQNGVVTEMPTLGLSAAGTNLSKIVGVSNDGIVAGYTNKYDGTTNQGLRGYTWHNGTFTELPTLGTDSSGSGQAFPWLIHPVTNVIIGAGDKYAGDDYIGTRPVTWHNGVITELPVLMTDANGYASGDTGDINTAGHVVGYTDHYVNGQGKGFHATRWQNGVAHDLGTLGASSTGESESNAFGINDAGHVIGNSQKYDANGVDKGLRGVVWRPDGQMIEVPALGAPPDGVGYSNMWDLNAAGQAVGTTRKYSPTGATLGSRALFVDTEGVTTFIDPPGDANGFGFSRPQVIADDGWVFGDYYKYDDAGVFLGQYAFAWSKSDGLIDLDTFLPGGAAAHGWEHLVYVSGMNDLGQIVGYGNRLDGETQGFVLTPIPEPTAAAVVAAPLLALTLSRRRRGLRHVHPCDERGRPRR